MLNISPVNFIKTYSNINTEKQTNPFYINRTLQADTVNFSGKSFKKEAEQILKKDTARFYAPEEFQSVIKNITPKSKPFLKDLLEIHNKKLSVKNITDMLEWINKPYVNAEQMQEKITNFKNLKHILTESFGFIKSPVADYLDYIPSKDVVSLLKTTILSAKGNHDFNFLTESYNTFLRYYDYYKNKTESSSPVKMSEESLCKTAMKSFYPCLAFASIFNPDAFTELWYNRSKYINLYLDRLHNLDPADILLLRKIQSFGITDKENRDGEIVSYSISTDDKIGMLNLLSCNKDIIKAGGKGLDFNNYITNVNTQNKNSNIKVDFKNLKIDLMEEVLKNLKIPDETVKKYMTNFRKCYCNDKTLDKNRNKFWDINYVHLLNANIDPLINDRLKAVIINATNNKFENFIYKQEPLASINKANEEAFKKENINYEEWINTTKTKPKSKKFTDKYGKEKMFTVKNWNRNPQESLFDGNYTTCCTGIDKDHGNSFIDFLTNTCTTTLEVRTEKNKVIGMSRLFMAKINGKNSIVVENIEVNNKMVRHYLYNDKAKYEYREMIFDYIREFAKNLQLNKKEEMPIYFSGKYYKVKGIEKGLNTSQNYDDVVLIGKFPDRIYINSYGSVYDQNTIGYRDEDDGFVLHLSDITKKNKPVYSNQNDIESDSNYNYADTERF